MEYRGCPGPQGDCCSPKPTCDPCCGPCRPACPDPCCEALCAEFPRIIKKSQTEWSPSCTPFEGCSTYRVDYRGCFGSPASPFKPRNTFDGSCARMEGCTTYRTNYVPYCRAEAECARGKYVKPNQESVMSCQPFNACSTYRMEYVPKCCPKTLSMKPPNRTGWADSPFCARTTYRNDYLPFYYRKCCPDNCPPSNSCCLPRCCP